MRYDSVVPECHTARLPLPADREIVSSVEVLAQEIQDMVRLLILQLGDTCDKAGVVKERLHVCDWVCSDLT